MYEFLVHLLTVVLEATKFGVSVKMTPTNVNVAETIVGRTLAFLKLHLVFEICSYQSPLTCGDVFNIAGQKAEESEEV